VSARCESSQDGLARFGRVSTVGAGDKGGRRSLKRTTKWFARAALVVMVVVGHAPAALADASQEADLASRVNALRTSRGVAPLVVDQGIAATARNWASRIAANGALSHNPDLASQLPPGWTDMGENAAFGPDTATMERDLENDPPHLANLVNPRFTHMGIGVVEMNGRLWAVQDFAGYRGGSPGAGGAPQSVQPYGDPYAQSNPSAQPYAQPASYGQTYGQWSPPPTAPAASPVTTVPTTVPTTPPVTVASATAVPIATSPPPTTTATATTPTAAVGNVAFTGSPVERHLRWAAAALAFGLILLTARGLVDLHPSR
jgi:hypothetical protein